MWTWSKYPENCSSDFKVQITGEHLFGTGAGWRADSPLWVWHGRFAAVSFDSWPRYMSFVCRVLAGSPEGFCWSVWRCCVPFVDATRSWNTWETDQLLKITCKESQWQLVNSELQDTGVPGTLFSTISLVVYTWILGQTTKVVRQTKDYPRVRRTRTARGKQIYWDCKLLKYALF